MFGFKHYLTLHLPTGLILQGEHSKPYNDPLEQIQDLSEMYHLDWLNFNDNNHLGDSIQSIHKSLSYKPIHKFNKSHLLDYTKSSRSLNFHLFNKFNNGEEPEEEYYDKEYDISHYIPDLDESVKDHQLDHELHTYAGVRWNPDFSASANYDRRLILPAYSSTSISKSVAEDYTDKTSNERHILHFILPAGHEGTYLGVNSHFPKEYEFLLPRKVIIKISKLPTTINKGSTKLHIWHVKPI